ncbi:MAG: hypothetical protein LM590_16940 [Thermofilum sp.]|nr:hypothetical protein [Thermofilum sp.]
MKTYAQGGNYYLRVKLDHVVLNGQTLDVSNPTIVVNPGSRLTGTVTFTVENVQPSSWITPVIWVASWERGSTADGKVRVVATTIWATEQFTVSIDVTVPTTPGTYYLGFFRVGCTVARNGAAPEGRAKPCLSAQTALTGLRD